MKYALLILLGSLWAARLSAIKWAGLSGIPAFVTVTLAIFGVVIVLILMAIARRTWPPLSRATLVFYVLSGSFGFVLPFFLEAVIAPHLPVFVFIVIIATMPLLTQILAVAVGLERPNLTQVAVVIAGFAISGLVIWDSTGAADGTADTYNLVKVHSAWDFPKLREKTMMVACARFDRLDRVRSVEPSSI